MDRLESGSSKKHLGQKAHVDSVTKLKNQRRGILKSMLTESKEEREMRKEIAQRQQATPDEVKILIDNVLLAIKINSSMLSVQDIHDHVGKYVKIPESWRSKNYAFEFSECVNSVVKTEMFTEIKNAAYHTLIVDESTDISVSKMLILYMKYRNENESIYKTVFAGILKAKFEELAKAADADVIAFRPLHEVRWLSRHFAVNALVKNYDVFLQYCQEKVEEDNDPVHRYCLEKLSKPELHVAIGILNDVLAELAELLSTVEAFQFAKAKIKKLRSQYLGENKHFLEETSILISSFKVPVITTSIIKFIQQEEYSFGHEQMKSLATRYCLLLQKDEDILKSDLCMQYSEFKILINEKLKCGSLTFSDILAFPQQQDHLNKLFLIMDICGTFQASSADCERGFSLMNSIKTKARNRLEVEHLDHLMRIKLFLNSGKTVNKDKVYNFWKAEKNRRETF
ncbi:E3 SUMO-protein ligase [Biomphalaria pfeifferi]|uniref:E3 SUMO-protein ligase n=1 Tax=Biomphalaria pfeifferi TaxID=112525 RepID=A0AAD8AX32_BIOPF|nr:E3 SUMO-protein ligase [Biomphalaria pfeifferi]